MKKTIYLVILSLGFIACEKIVEIEIPSEEDRVVVESEIYSTKEVWKVKLSQSQEFFDQGSAEDLSSASVYIAEVGGDTVFLNYSDSGVYVSADSQQCIVGRSYTLNIAYNGEVYTATEQLQNAFPLDTVMSFFLPPNDRSFPTGNYVFIQGQSDTTMRSYYLFRTFRNDTLKSSDLDDDEFGSASLLNSQFNVDDILGEIALGKLPRPILFDVNAEDTIRVEQYAITREYYEFLLAVNAQQSIGGTPFDPPPANPNNNMSNGALGYFTVAHKEVKTLIVTE